MTRRRGAPPTFDELAALVLALDYGLIGESLSFAEQKFRDYAGYPSYEYKKGRVAEAQAAHRALTALSRAARRLAPR